MQKLTAGKENIKEFNPPVVVGVGGLCQWPHVKNSL